jgi:hypothetical protein
VPACPPVSGGQSLWRRHADSVLNYFVKFFMARILWPFDFSLNFKMFQP